MNHVLRFFATFLVTAVVLAGCSGGTSYEKAIEAAQSGEYEKAVQMLSELAKSSSDPAIFGNRANCYSYLGNLDAALADYQTAFELIKKQSPRYDKTLLPMLHYNRGVAYRKAKKFKLAVADYELTIKAQPDYPDVMGNLAWILATCPDASVRNPKRAVELATKELSHAKDDPSVLDTLAACHAAAGNFSQAVSMQQRATELCQSAEEKERFAARLEMYRNRKPFVDTE